MANSWHAKKLNIYTIFVSFTKNTKHHDKFTYACTEEVKNENDPVFDAIRHIGTDIFFTTKSRIPMYLIDILHAIVSHAPRT